MENRPRRTTSRKKEVKTNPTVELLPSGCTLLDLAMGGGFPWGKNTNIVGERSAGKTILTCEILAQAKKIYKESLKLEYDDSENGFSIPTEALYGMWRVL